MNLRKFSTLLFLSIAIWMISGCTTQKTRGEYTGLKKVYHNTTQRYNGYFNATVLMDEAYLALDQQHLDNYNQILPIYPYTKVDNPQAVAESMDIAMEKVSVAVNLHRGANWTDDCYLLMGQAQYLKQDYESAEETFEFMEVEFSPDLKKRGSLSKRAAANAAKTKAEKEKYKKERQKELKEEREERADTAKEKKKTKEKEAKAKKKAREKAKKAKAKEIKAKKKARAKARKSGGKAPPRTSSTTTPKKETTKPKPTTQKEDEEKEKIAKEEKEKKKKEMIEEPDSYFLKHRPVYREGLLWLARTYIERQNWNLANSKLSTLENDPKVTKELAVQIPVVRAYFYAEQKQYDEVVPHLEKAIELESDRALKARYAYIIAQIYEKSGDWEKAVAGFERALKFRPGYAMEFSTRLNLIQGKYRNGKSTAESANKELNRLLKDIKNEEYSDQIYYALALIAFENGEKEVAIQHLESSLGVPSSNPANQAEAYYKLANIYLEKEDYVSAKSYFDSTIGVLSKKDERYKECELLAKNLTDIAANLLEIELQDSLLMLSKLTDEERRTRAFEVKKAENEARRQAILAKVNGGNNGTSVALKGNSKTTGVRAGTKPSNFFAYDDRSVKRGLRDFQREWGDRPLADNWRFKRESSLEEIDATEELDNLAETVITDEDVKLMFKDVPDTPEAKKEAQKKIEEALFNLGRLYRDKLKYNEKAIITLEDLLRRNPDTEFEPDALYYLYLAYKDVNNTAKANDVKDRLLGKYADTTFGRIISDPDYASKNADKNYSLNKFYEETYSSFKNGKYAIVKTKIEQVPAKFGAKNPLAPRFALLNAMTIGNLNGKEAYIKALKDVIAMHPKTPEESRSREILRLLGVKSASGGVSTGVAEEGTYKVEAEKLHYMIVVFKNSEINLTDAKVAVSDYHQKYHKLDKLRISNIYLGGTEDKIPLIVVRRFKNQEVAMAYYDSVQKNSKDFVTKEQYDIFPVTQSNYRQILKSKSLEGYQDFFETNYLD